MPVGALAGWPGESPSTRGLPARESQLGVAVGVASPQTLRMKVSGVEDFRRHAREYWESVADGDARAATAHTDAAERVAGAWPEPLRREVLAALMDDEDRRVRYAAAALAGPGNKAEAVLAALASGPTGLVAPTAKMLLAQWRARR